METQEDKNKQKESKEELKVLQKDLKMAFKGKDQQGFNSIADKIKAIDPEDRLLAKLTAKLEKMKIKEEAKAKAEKVKEYEVMLKTLHKNKNVEKLAALATEFKNFDPKNKQADKWLQKTEKLKEELAGKQLKPEVEPSKDEKPGFLSKFFKKNEKPESDGEKLMAKEENKPEITTAQTPVPSATPKVATAPATPLQPVASVTSPISAPPTPVAPKPEVKTEAIPTPKAEQEEKKEEKGNIFTKMFKKKDEETSKKSIIDTIVAKTEKKKDEEKTPERKFEFGKPAEKQKESSLLSFSKIFMNFTAIFVVLSAVFLYVEWIDKENTMLSLVGISENTGLKLHSAAQEVEGLKKEESKLNKDIELYKGGYSDQALTTVGKIIDERIDWPTIFSMINEVTNSVYELNDFFKYIEYNNYSFDANSRTIRVSGTLSDPLGRNLTKLVELEEAFKYYPKDKNNPEDTTEPYFTGFKEFTSFSKTLDADTGRYRSNFQLSFALND